MAALFGIILGAAYFIGIYHKHFLGECRHEVVADAVGFKKRELLIVFVMNVLVLVVGLYPQSIINVIENSSQLWVNVVTR